VVTVLRLRLAVLDATVIAECVTVRRLRLAVPDATVIAEW
jgi:hypothetical protein